MATALVAAAALLLSLLSAIGHAGLVSLGKFVGESSRHVATSAPAASPTQVSSWLQVAPSSVQFGCADGQRSQVVVLENRGPSQVHWQASLSLPTEQAGVDVTPHEGDLGPGASTIVQLQDTSHFSGQSVVIRFNPSDREAGSPPSLSFTLVGCN